MGKKKALIASELKAVELKRRAIAAKAVFDTNCLVSGLIFKGGRLAWLRRTWESGVIIPLVSQATISELVRVLTYPKFGLAQSDCQALLEEFLTYATVVEVKLVRSKEYISAKSALTDQNDQMFLDLAYSGKADVLVTGDKALMQLAGDIEAFKILSPKDFREWLDDRLWLGPALNDDSDRVWD